MTPLYILLILITVVLQPLQPPVLKSQSEQELRQSSRKRVMTVWLL